MLKKYEFILKDLDCAHCANKIQNKLSENKDYKNVVVNFNTLRLSLESDLDNIKPNIVEVISKLEPEVEVIDVNEKRNEEEESVNLDIIRLIVGIFFTVLGSFLKLPGNYNLICIIIAYVIMLSRVVKNAVKLIFKKTIDENFLITISCIGAFIIGERLEGLMVIILYEIGELLEDMAVDNTRKSISDLMDIKPEYANIKLGDEIKEVSPEIVKLNDIVVIKKGEKIPLDGVVINGEASLNTSSLTGESRIRKVNKGDEVLSGSINEEGIIEIKVTEKYENSTVSKILELVENATDKKAKTETFVNKWAKIYTPVVVGLACLIAVLLPLISSLSYSESVYRALIFLVVSCPCAIVISVPLSYFSGIGRASKSGILIKGSDYLDNLRRIKEIAFDKTGTLTKGEFGIEKIVTKSSKYTKDDVLEYAVLGEYFSNHPIAKSILKEFNKEIDTSKVKDFEEISGKGISYKYDYKEIKIGNNELVECEKENEIGTVIYVKVEKDIIGYILLNDSIKSDSKQTIKELNKLGVKTRMFTGDNEEIALKVGKQLELDDIKCEMLPEDKYRELEKIIDSYKDTENKVAFVGDGINDSPVLARADIGISMGGVGSSSAIEASDVVIMTDDLSKIKEAINISNKTAKIIKQNLIFALAVKVLVLCLSVFGLATMWQAVFADVGVTLITIVNTMRILK